MVTENTTNDTDYKKCLKLVQQKGEKIFKNVSNLILTLVLILTVILQTISLFRNYKQYIKFINKKVNLVSNQNFISNQNLIDLDKLKFDKEQNKKLNLFLQLVSIMGSIAAVFKIILAATNSDLIYKTQIVICLVISLLINIFNTYLTQKIKITKDNSEENEKTQLIIKSITSGIVILCSFFIFYHKSINGSINKLISWKGSTMYKTITQNIQYLKENPLTVIFGGLGGVIILVVFVIFILS
tara:strand:- start:1657 stop:2382 length:726 start_codon:yes stop_codon:yes gene_type:complete